MIYFDIETEPLSPEECEIFMPDFEAPSNYKDAVKIADNIAEQKAKWLERAALSPLTGKVLAIGFKDDASDEITILHGDDEEYILRTFISNAKDVSAAPLIGYNIIGFDIPFLKRRAWKYGIKVPAWWTAKAGWGKAPMVVDLMEEWKCGDYRAAFAKLDHVAKFLGLEGKTSDSLAKNFGDVYRSDETAALEYLTRDVELVEEIYGRMFL